MDACIKEPGILPSQIVESLVDGNWGGRIWGCNIIVAVIVQMSIRFV